MDGKNYSSILLAQCSDTVTMYIAYLFLTSAGIVYRQ